MEDPTAVIVEDNNNERLWQILQHGQQVKFYEKALISHQTLRKWIIENIAYSANALETNERSDIY